MRSVLTVSSSPKWMVSSDPESSTFVHCFSRCSLMPRFLNCFVSSFDASVLLRDQ